MTSHVLVIEDEPDIRKTIDYNLSKESFKVIQAASIEAVAICLGVFGKSGCLLAVSPDPVTAHDIKTLLFINYNWNIVQFIKNGNNRFTNRFSCYF